MNAIDWLSELHKGATPGEWQYDAGEIGIYRGRNPDGHPVIRMIVQDTMGDIERNAVEPEDGEYIALAHNLMPHILGVLRVAKRNEWIKNRGMTTRWCPECRALETSGHVEGCKLGNALDALQEGGES